MVLTPRDVTLGDTSFTAGALTIAYEAVTSIRVDWIALKVIPSGGTTHQAEFRVFVENQTTPIMVTSSRMRWLPSAFSHTAPKAHALIDVCEQVMARTLAPRLRRYLEQINRQGWFSYDRKRFGRDGTVLSSGGKPLFNLRSVRLFRHPARIEWRPKQGVASYLARVAPLPGHTIHTQFDTDVLYRLLDKLYGIRWPRESEAAGAEKA